ncbi:hypothetical protein C8A01DRAFT_51409 [Parachaetomium inaequale]|uniref:Protein kinase domain-containing protein n=1 Tax=Parachaetomium inaequale TaxID=2588326 RepID=A0AAN6P702_9PEZI|nr:hypothetical protein C8A01DRAFT_51409 [Parachaetomium inaequale]
MSIINGVEACYKYGKALVDFCQRWKDADAELADRVIMVELCWMNTSAQLQLVEMLHPVLNDEIRRIFDDSLAVLARKLDLTVVQAQKLQDPCSSARPGFLHFRRRASGAKYAWNQTVLDAAIQDLEAWQGRCKVALDLNMRDPNPLIDERLKKLRQTQHPMDAAVGAQGATATTTAASPLSLTGGIRDALQPMGTQPSVFLPNVVFETTAIPFSRARAACMQSPFKTRWFILDTLPCRPETNVRALQNDVRDLALKLGRADPFAFGLLNCKGAMRAFKPPPRQLDLAGFDLVFNVPEGTDAKRLQSLRALLLSRDGAPSLSRRVRLAQELATSVSYVHTFIFVHKNIRPESVLLFQETQGGGGSSQPGTCSATPANRRTSFLIGFESFRSAARDTSLTGDQDWAHNIYRHPERMGEFPAEAYTMQHDIYSLGVCLLEIGLWEPLVEYVYRSGGDAEPEWLIDAAVRWIAG